MGKVKRNALKIIKRLHDAGFTAYIVGGAVRDMVMSKEPEDYDIATDAPPAKVARLFRRVIPVGREFGVSMVVLGGKQYEVAGFRSEGVYLDGRRPSYTEPSTELEDVKRRDFTVNAMLYDIVSGRVIDYVGGRDDIEKRIIRTVGKPDERFAEDRLRMLRAVRFASRLDFTIDSATFEAICRNASGITDVSFERIGEELSKMVTGSHPERALSLLDETGLLAVILPEVAAMKGVEQPPLFHPEGDVFAHTRHMLDLFGGGSVTLAFGILLHDVGKPATFTVTDRIRFNRHDEVGADIAGSVLSRLRFSKEIISRVRALVKNHMRFMHVPDMKQSTLRRFMALEGFDEMLELFRLDCRASHTNLDIYEFIRQEMEREIPVIPDPLLTGDDLIAAGYEPGPVFSTILGKLVDAQLEGIVINRDQARSFVLRHYPPEKKRQNQRQRSNQSDSPESRDDKSNT